MDDRFSGISTGFNKAIGQDEWERVKKFFGQFIPKGEPKGDYEEAGDTSKGGLVGDIANVRRMVTNPESDSSDWTPMQIQFLQSDDLHDLSEGDLKYLYNKVFGENGGDMEEMIEALEAFRDTGV